MFSDMEVAVPGRSEGQPSASCLCPMSTKRTSYRKWTIIVYVLHTMETAFSPEILDKEVNIGGDPERTRRAGKVLAVGGFKVFS